MNKIDFDLIKAITKQIIKDVNYGDYTAIEELLKDIPIEKLKGFLADE